MIGALAGWGSNSFIGAGFRGLREGELLEVMEVLLEGGEVWSAVLCGGGVSGVFLWVNQREAAGGGLGPPLG